MTIGFELLLYSVTEGSGTSVEFEVCAVVLEGTLEREVIVTFFTTDGTATSVGQHNIILCVCSLPCYIIPVLPVPSH